MPNVAPGRLPSEGGGTLADGHVAHDGRGGAVARVEQQRPGSARCALPELDAVCVRLERERKGEEARVLVAGRLPVLGVLELDRDATVREHRAGGGALDEPVLARRPRARLRNGRGEVRLDDARPLRRPGADGARAGEARRRPSSSPTSRRRASPRRARSRSPSPDRASGTRSSPDLRRRRAGTSNPGPRGAC